MAVVEQQPPEILTKAALLPECSLPESRLQHAYAGLSGLLSALSNASAQSGEILSLELWQSREDWLGPQYLVQFMSWTACSAIVLC